MKTTSKYFIAYLDKYIRPLVLIMPKKSVYFKTFKMKDKISIIISFRIDDEKLLEKYNAIWIETEDVNYIKWNTLSVYDDRYIKSIIRIYGHKVYTNMRGFNMPEDNTERKYLTVTSINSLFVHENKHYLKVYLGNWAYKIVNKQMTIIQKMFLKIIFCKYCITKELI